MRDELKFFQTKYFFAPKFFSDQKIFRPKFFRNLKICYDNLKMTKPSHNYQIKPVKPNLSSQIYLQNQAYQTILTKLTLPNQTYKTKPTKPKFPKEQNQSAKIKFMS